jgi:uncharacterized protein CbrC (UPF0167 family)
MLDDEPTVRAAQAILKRLQAKEQIETANPDGVKDDLMRALVGYEQGVDAQVRDVLGSAKSLAAAQEALLRRAVAAGVPLDEEAIPVLLPQLAEVLEDSPHVEEIFADDDALEKVLRAALLDFLPAVAWQARAKLAAAFVKPRSTLPASQKPASIADDGYTFPLFEGPVESAALDDEGPCAYCGATAKVRFARACYPCFRAGKANDHVMGTELGVVRAEDAVEGLTHGLPATLAPAGYERVELERDDEDDEAWVRIRVDPASLGELLRTPKYDTWQGEYWLFCCQKPMVFVGPLKEPLLERLRKSEQTQEEVVARLLQVESREAHKRTTEVLLGRISMYVFRCPHCEKHRAHFDAA